MSGPERPDENPPARKTSGKLDLPLKGGVADLEIGPRPEVTRRPSKRPAVKPPPESKSKPARGAPSRSSHRTWLAAALALAAGALAGWFLKPDPAVAVLSTELVDFGEVRIETESEGVRVDFVNGGGGTLGIGAVTVKGDQAAEFTVVADGCSGQSLAAEAGCSIEVAFIPGEVGRRRARLTVEGPEGGELRFAPRLPLVGLGIAPQLEAEPLALDFGEQLVGSSSRRSAVRVANRGSAPLAIRGVRLEGTGAADFEVRDRCSGTTLAPGERCTLEYAFRPTAVGERRAELRLATDGGDALAASPELKGSGLPRQAALRISPARLELGEQRVGAASGPMKVTIANDGTAPLRLRELEIRSDDPAAGFELRPGTCKGATLGPGKSCAVEVVFQPRADGGHTATLEVSHDAGGSRRVPLAGTGTRPEIFLDPLVLDFGQATVGNQSDSKFLRVVNSGSGALEIDEIRLRGAGAQAFTARPVGCTTAPIKPKSSCGVEVRFKPHRAGAFEAELVLGHNADGGSSRVEIRGLGRVP